MSNQEFYPNQVFDKIYPPEAAMWCNNNGCYIERRDGKYVIVEIPPPSPEEIAEAEMKKAKEQRAEYVSKIIVTVDDLPFDGDETSQDRMARSCVALNEGETVQWVLADNTIAQVTKEQLRQALRLAGEAQTAIWADPYLGEETETEEEESASV